MFSFIIVRDLIKGLIESFIGCFLWAIGLRRRPDPELWAHPVGELQRQGGTVSHYWAKFLPTNNTRYLLELVRQFGPMFGRPKAHIFQGHDRSSSMEDMREVVVRAAHTLFLNQAHQLAGRAWVWDVLFNGTFELQCPNGPVDIGTPYVPCLDNFKVAGGTRLSDVLRLMLETAIALRKNGVREPISVIVSTDGWNRIGDDEDSLRWRAASERWLRKSLRRARRHGIGVKIYATIPSRATRWENPETQFKRFIAAAGLYGSEYEVSYCSDEAQMHRAYRRAVEGQTMMVTNSCAY